MAELFFKLPGWKSNQICLRLLQGHTLIKITSLAGVSNFHYVSTKNLTCKRVSSHITPLPLNARSDMSHLPTSQVVGLASSRSQR
eukprot:1402727-Amphidinium_carterae.1